VFPPAPSSLLDAAGRPRVGAFIGSIERVDLRPIVGRGVRATLRRLTSLKRWHHALVAAGDVVATVVVVDAGYAASGFAFAVDRRSRAVLLDRAILAAPVSVHVNDRPGAGARASLDARGAALRIERRSDRYQLLADLGAEGRLQAELDTAGAPPPFTLVAPVAGGVLHVTQKSGALPAHGELTLPDRRVRLDGGLGGLDYTQGLLARATRWRWAYATGLARGAPLGLNLVEGFDAVPVTEDVLFLAGSATALPRCTFSFRRADPLAPWRIASGDGAVDLRFLPAAAHREARHLGLVRTRFVQVVGTFAGRVPGPDGPLDLDALPGVCEDQDARW
jgi:hypothetical protein